MQDVVTLRPDGPAMVLELPFWPRLRRYVVILAATILWYPIAFSSPVQDGLARIGISGMTWLMALIFLPVAIMGAWVPRLAGDLRRRRFRLQRTNDGIQINQARLPHDQVRGVSISPKRSILGREHYVLALVVSPTAAVDLGLELARFNVMEPAQEIGGAIAEFLGLPPPSAG